MIIFILLILAALINPAFALSPNYSLLPTIFSIPDGEVGIGFNDLVYSPELHKVLVPAGHTGKLFLIDPLTLKITSISGFSSRIQFIKGKPVGITSADEGDGIIFVADHGTNQLVAVNPQSGVIIATADLAGYASYVRYVGGRHEVWVTEPDNKQIEVFKFEAGDKFILKTVLFIHLSDNPIFLVIDQTRGRAYTNLGPNTAAISLESHAVIATWPNDCEKSNGDALDEKRGFLFVSCDEGKAVVFALDQGNKEIDNLDTDPEPNVISYNPKLSHLYFTSSQNATLSVIGVSAQGKLTLLGQGPANKRSHCVVGDDQDNIWVCDPLRGKLLLYKDSLKE